MGDARREFAKLADAVEKWLEEGKIVDGRSADRLFPHPYMVEVYVAEDESEACLSPDPPKAFCTQDGAVKEVRLELAFSRYETYEDKTREVHRQKGLLAFTTAAKEYVRVL